jgi:hypothetical protein
MTAGPVALALPVVGVAAPASDAQGPTLRVVRERPLVLRGADFRPRERVRVTVRAGATTWTRQTQAGPRGGFTVGFRVRVDFCATPVRILAYGRSTGTVRAKLPQRECPSP